MSDEIRDKHIQYLLNEFDFDKVQQVMQVLDWRWDMADERLNNKVPTTDLLRSTAHNLLILAWEQGGRLGTGATVSTGGFRIEFNWQGDVPYLRLVFELEQVGSWYA